MHWIISTIFIIATFSVASADDSLLIREARPLDPDALDIVGEFHQVGYPKYTDVERLVIARAQKEQDAQAAVYTQVKIGTSVFEYPGLIALGSMQYSKQAKIPYSLIIGIRPHISEFSNTFGEFQIGIDAKGVVQTKSAVEYEWKKPNKSEQATPRKPSD